MFLEPGRGTIDFAQLRRTPDEIGYDGWAVVEQDMYPAPLDAPLPIARRTREHLEQGLQHLTRHGSLGCRVRPAAEADSGGATHEAARHARRQVFDRRRGESA